MTRNSGKYIKVLSQAEWSRLFRRSLAGIGLLMGASGLTAGLMCRCLMNWEDAAEDLVEGPILKWAENQTHRVTFLPDEVIIEPGKGTNDDEVLYFKYKVILHAGGRDRPKVISTAARKFIEQILAYQKRKELIGVTFDIKATGVNKQRRYTMVPVE